MITALRSRKLLIKYYKRKKVLRNSDDAASTVGFFFFLPSFVLAGSSVKLHTAVHGFITFACVSLNGFTVMAQTDQSHWINKSLAEEWLARDRGGVGWKWQVFVVILGPYVSNLRALCTLA